eukprot:scaffold173940_cov31-Tisochrysis_lutea.AAC.1
MIPRLAAGCMPVCVENSNFTGAAPGQVEFGIWSSRDNCLRLRHVELSAREVDAWTTQQHIRLVRVQRLVLVRPIDAALAIACGKYFSAEGSAACAGTKRAGQRPCQRREMWQIREPDACVGTAAPASATLAKEGHARGATSAPVSS